VDVDPLPHRLGSGGSLQLGLCSVGFPLPSALRGMSAVYTVNLTWWVCVPTPAVDVVMTSSCSSRGASSSRLVPSAEHMSTTNVGVPVGLGDSFSREDGAGVQRVHERLDRLMASSVSTNYYTCWFERNYLLSYLTSCLDTL
jgi:hypothetical protein